MNIKQELVVAATAIREFGASCAYRTVLFNTRDSMFPRKTYGSSRMGADMTVALMREVAAIVGGVYKGKEAGRGKAGIYFN